MKISYENPPIKNKSIDYATKFKIAMSLRNLNIEEYLVTRYHPAKILYFIRYRYPNLKYKTQKSLITNEFIIKRIK